MMESPDQRGGRNGQTPPPDGDIVVREVVMQTVTRIGGATVRLPLIGYAVQRGETLLAVFALRAGAQQFADAVRHAVAAPESSPPPDAGHRWTAAAVARLAVLCTACGAIHVVDPALRAALARPEPRTA